MKLFNHLSSAFLSGLAMSSTARAQVGPNITASPVDIFGVIPGTNSSAAWSDLPILARDLGPMLRPAPQEKKGKPVEPVLPPRTKCGYTYAGAKSNLPGFMYDITALDLPAVSQGGVGDCGLGAALATLVANHRAYPRIQSRFPASSSSYFVQFYKDATTKGSVVFSDQLPVAKPANPKQPCFTFLGYSPTVGTGGWPVYYMPYLEKAVALWLDKNPSLKTKSRPGYRGIESIDPSVCLALLTGQDATATYRSTRDVDAQVLAAIRDAVAKNRPAIISSIDKKSLKTIVGKKSQYNAKLSTFSLTNGATVKYEDPYFTYDDGSGKLKSIVEGHAYALLPNSTDTDIWLYNPWGFTAYADGTRDRFGAVNLPPEAVANLFTAITSIS